MIARSMQYLETIETPLKGELPNTLYMEEMYQLFRYMLKYQVEDINV